MLQPRRLALIAILLVAVAAVAYVVTDTGERAAARVTVVDENGTALARVDVAVADTSAERYTGLSDTDSLGPDDGMLFVFDGEDDRAFVMRDMAFPIDIIFVGADRRVTTIHEAETESGPPWTRYPGRAKWVLEVNAGYAAAHGIEPGDRIRITYRNETG